MTNQVTLQHVVDREVLHFAWSYMITDWVWLGLHSLHRLSHPAWLGNLVPDTILGQYVMAAFLVVFSAFLREPRDVQAGDPAWKSYVDLSWWGVGAVLAAFVNYVKSGWLC